MSVSLPPEVIPKLEALARRYGVTPGELVARLVEELEGTEDAELSVAVADGLLRYTREAFGTTAADKPFEYPGGDWYIRDSIIRLLVRSGCSVLVEVFGGSGVISMYAPRRVFKVVIYNDKDELLYSFFKCLRECPTELARRLILMPFARRLHEELSRDVSMGRVSRMDPVEKAVVFFYLARTSFSGSIGNSFRVVKDPRNNRARIYARKVASLVELASRWLDVILENRDFRELIPLYDSDHTVFYCDPPYVSTDVERDHYRLGFTDRDMGSLLSHLARVKGRFVLKLQEDNLKLPYVWRWVEERGYRVTYVEHFSYVGKVAEGKRRGKLKTALVSNY